MATPRRAHALGGAGSERLGGVHGPELVARGRAARAAGDPSTGRHYDTLAARALARGMADWAMLHARTAELIRAGYSGGRAPGRPLHTRDLGGRGLG